MHKKFEEFVLGKSGLDSMGQVYKRHCPDNLGLLGAEPCSGECPRCWGYAGELWVKANVFETTTEAPTEEGFYFAREFKKSAGWTIVDWYKKQMLVPGWGETVSWDSEWWERSVERIQMPEVRDGE
jgi:hypothetical protein